MTFEELTATLERLRIHPLTVEIPFAQAGGHVHLYFVEDSRPALFDTGLHTETNELAIERALNKLGYSLSDIQRVFLTHGHIDHYGNACRLQKMGAEIHLHPADVPKVTTLSEEQTEHYKTLYVAEFLRHGFPSDLVEHVDKIFLNSGAFAPKLTDAILPVRDGDRFAFDRFEVRTVHVPGHTPGCVAYFLGDSGVAVTGDHLLKTISPNPLFELSVDGDKFPSLVTYFHSLERVMTEGLRLALPAHGPFITDVGELVTSLTAFYQRRQAKLLRMLDQPAAAFALCQTYYRRLRDLETFLGFSEILGNLDMMVDRGEVVLDDLGERYLYRRIVDEPLPIKQVA